MYTIVTDPENLARHAREYQLLLDWFTRRQHELGLDQLSGGIRWIHITHITKRSTHCVKKQSSIGVKSEIIGRPPCNCRMPSFKWRTLFDRITSWHD